MGREEGVAGIAYRSYRVSAWETGNTLAAKGQWNVRISDNGLREFHQSNCPP